MPHTSTARHHYDYGFHAVLYSLPTFGENNFSIFAEEFAQADKSGDALKVCVVMLHRTSQIHFVFSDPSPVVLARFLGGGNHTKRSHRGRKMLSGIPLLRTAALSPEDRSMMSLADHLSRKGHKAGILNPSDIQAVREGYIGMYWDGGHVALEELLAMQTTLLLHHKGVNPTLYTDAGRWKPLRLGLAPKTAPACPEAAFSSSQPAPPRLLLGAESVCLSNHSESVSWIRHGS